MNLVQRAINMITQPRPEWARVDSEPATVAGLFTGYAVILALLPLVGQLLMGLLFAGVFGFTYFLVMGIVGYVVGLAVLYAMILIANALAPSFGGTRSDVAAAKLLIFAATPIWLAGLLGFIPGINIIVMLVGFGFAAYLLYIGSTIVMKIPADKAAGYTAVVIIIWIVVSFIASAIIGAVVLSAVVGTAAIGGGMMLR